MKGSQREPVGQQAWQDSTEEEPSLENRVMRAWSSLGRKLEIVSRPDSSLRLRRLRGIWEVTGSRGDSEEESECVPRALLLFLLSELVA